MHRERILEGLEDENGRNKDNEIILPRINKKIFKKLSYPENIKIFTKIAMRHIKSDQVEIIQNKIFLL